MPASIRDVASRAGVSVATVSHVINGTRFVTQDTRAKVQAAIDELQYSPNILARQLRTGSLDTVGFIVPDIANGYFATLIEEVEDVLRLRGFRLLVSNTREDPLRETDSLRMLSSGVVDGLLLASTIKNFDEIRDAVPAGFPIVLVDRAIPHAPVDTVITDNTAAIRGAMGALISRGHEKIGLMASAAHLSTTKERVRAYRDALKEQGLPINRNAIRYLKAITDPVGPSAQALLDLGCTAIVASNNVLTNKLIAAFSDPSWGNRRADIVGYLDPTHQGHSLAASEWIEEPVTEVGRLAGEAIVRRIAEPGAERLVTKLHATLSMRPDPREHSSTYVVDAGENSGVRRIAH